MKKVTIIVPVYNAMTVGGGYIRRCFDSIVSQADFALKDIEILFINDGSTDTSLESITEYKTQYPDVVTIIDQHNMGVAKTRNKGIRLAKGEYIMFLDQDDWLDADYVKTFYDAISAGDYDVVSGGYRRPNTTGSIQQQVMPKDTEYGKYIVTAAWAKIHRADFLRSNDIEFFSNKIGEDLVFTVKEIANTDRYKQIPYIGYNWFFNEESVSNTSQKKLNQQNIDSVITLLQHMVTANDGNKAEKKIFEYVITRTAVYYLYLLTLGKNITGREFMDAAGQLLGWVVNEYPKIYRNTYIYIAPSGELFISRVVVPFIMICYKLKLLGVFARLYRRG